MLRKYLFTLRPQWIALHVFTVAAAVTMVLLGRWQLHVSESKHFDIQNFGYTIQWWAFAAFALFFWWRIVRDAARRRADPVTDAARADAERAAERSEPVAYRRYVMPAPAPVSDPVHAAYNDYLARLAAQDAEERA